jgi:hypothetical protein
MKSDFCSRGIKLRITFGDDYYYYGFGDKKVIPLEAWTDP